MLDKGIITKEPSEITEKVGFAKFNQ